MREAWCIPQCIYVYPLRTCVPHCVYMYPTAYVWTPQSASMPHCVRATPLYAFGPHCMPVYPILCVHSPLCVPACFVYPNCHPFTEWINSISQALSASLVPGPGVDAWTGTHDCGESQSCTPILRPTSCSIDTNYQVISFAFICAILQSCSLFVRWD